MRKWLLGLVALVGLAGCGGSHLTAQDQKDIAQIKPVVVKCVAKGNLTTHNGRQAILSCIAPPGHQASFERCASKYLKVTAFATSGRRDKTYQGLFTCWEHNR